MEIRYIDPRTNEDITCDKDKIFDALYNGGSLISKYQVTPKQLKDLEETTND